MAKQPATKPLQAAIAPVYRPRIAAAVLREYLRGYPVVAVTGPRQAGKSTMLSHELAQWPQVTLEDPDVRALTHEDPRGLLARHGHPLIIDAAQVHDLLLFQRFVRPCAGRIGQLINFSALAADAGISQPTANAWLAVLEAGYVVRRLAPYHMKFGKRLVWRELGDGGLTH